MLIALPILAFVSSSAVAAPEQPSPIAVQSPQQNADVQPPRKVFGNPMAVFVDAGPSMSAIAVADDAAITAHVQTNVFVGHRLSPDSTMWLGVGYRGSFEANDSELFTRHGVGVTVATKWVHAIGMAGACVGYGFDGTLFGGVSIGGAIGLRLGPITLNLPLYFDFIPVNGQMATVTTFSVTGGVAF
jgi:hypothetical protein